MKYACMDLENSGLFDYKQPADAPGQPRLAQFGLVLLDDELNAVGEIDHLIKPDGWEMTKEAQAVNGLTMERLNAEGVPIANVLTVYSSLILEGYAIATFGARFDTKQMRGELRRAGMPDLFEQTPNLCLMLASTPVCKLIGKRGYKWPKLSEACTHFGIGPEPTPHQAIEGARRAAQILIKLHALKALPEPEVHYAASRPDSAPAHTRPVAKASETKEEAY